MMGPKEIDAALREIEQMLLGLINVADDRLADPEEASASATIDSGMIDIHRKIVALRAALP